MCQAHLNIKYNGEQEGMLYTCSLTNVINSSEDLKTKIMKHIIIITGSL